MNSRTAAALAIGAAMLAAGGARAEDWTPFFIMPQGVVYLDKDSVAQRPGYVSARLESTFPEPQALNRDGKIFVYKRTIDKVEVDCHARVYANVSRALYTDDGLLQLTINEANSPIRVPNASAQAALITGFCDKKR